MEHKTLIQTLGGIGAFAIAWLGTSAYLASNAERDLAARIQQTANDCSVRLTNLQQHSALLSGSGRLEVQIGDLCNNAQTDKYWLVADLEYNINHLILPSSVMRFNWTLRQRHQADASGPTLQFNGSGGSTFSGAVYSDISSLELSGQIDNESWRLEPVTGRFQTKDHALDLNLKGSRFTAHGDGNAFDLQGIGLQVNLTDRDLGLGKSAFTIDKASTGAGSAERLSFSSETVQNGDRIDAKMLYALGGLNSMGYSAQDLAVEIAIKGLYAESVRTLADIAKQTRSPQNLTLDQNKRYRAALKQVVNQGFSTGITKLSGTVSNVMAKSALNGQLLIDIKPNSNPQGDIELAKVLQSSGQVTVSGDALDQNQQAQLVQMGLAKATADGLQAAYDYSAGILKTNDQIIDDQQVQQTLINADAEINTFLNQPEAVTTPEAGLDHVIAATTEEAVESDQAQEAAAPAPAATESLQSSSITGRVSYADTGALIEDQNGEKLYFVADSEIGRLIGSQCAEGDTCTLATLTDGNRQIKAIQQLRRIAPATPESATLLPATEEVAPSTGSAPQNPQPSFDCAKATTMVEKLICGSNELAIADAQLATQFKATLANALDSKPLIAEQRNWIKTVRNACTDIPCLAAVYQARISQLSQ